MSIIAQIWAYNDITCETYTVEKEINILEWLDIDDEIRRLISELNEENSATLYYLLTEHEQLNNTQKQWWWVWLSRIFDKWDTL
jgi:hypothetical protein